MIASMIDLRAERQANTDNLPGLLAHLMTLVGEPFRFARVSYGDELTLHFGQLRPARSPKLQDLKYGAYILGVRASPWLLKPGTQPVVVNAGVLLEPLPSELGQPVRKEDLEAGGLISPECLVLSATPFFAQQVNGFGLHVRLSDGSTLLIVPAPRELDEPGDEGLPELADWELVSPQGRINAGPGLNWSFEPT